MAQYKKYASPFDPEPSWSLETILLWRLLKEHSNKKALDLIMSDTPNMNLHVMNHRGVSLFHMAMETDSSYKIMSLLIEKGVIPDQQSLHSASRRLDTGETHRFLLSKMAEIEARKEQALLDQDIPSPPPSTMKSSVRM